MQQSQCLLQILTPGKTKKLNLKWYTRKNIKFVLSKR